MYARIVTTFTAVLLAIAVLMSGSEVGAVAVIPSDGATPKRAAPLIVTGYSFTSGELHYIQLYNDSNDVIDLRDWSVSAALDEQDVTIVGFGEGDYIAPKTYLLLASDTLFVGNDNVIHFRVSDDDTMATVTSITVVPSAGAIFAPHTTETPSLKNVDVTGLPVPTQYYVTRNVSAATGDYLSSLVVSAKVAPSQLYADPLYDFDRSTQLQIVEIMPNALACKPGIGGAGCVDYVKLYNTSSQSIDLAKFRLRTGMHGQKSTSTNTIQLSGIVPEGGYVSFALQMPNTAQWVWLEDRYGMQRYDTTLQDYPSAASMKGYAWAYDTVSGQWGWTHAQPGSLATNFVAIDQTKLCEPGKRLNPETNRCNKIATIGPVACKANQYRNPETNRCRNRTQPTTLAPCKPGQLRNLTTNRCRSVQTTTNSLTPCKPGQYRSPETNRCRSMATTSSSLAPCKPGQERNKETNRCRKIMADEKTMEDFPVQAITEQTDTTVSWVILGSVLALVLGRMGWEWRHELTAPFRRLAKAFVTPKE